MVKMEILCSESLVLIRTAQNDDSFKDFIFFFMNFTASYHLSEKVHNILSKIDFPFHFFNINTLFNPKYIFFLPVNGIVSVSSSRWCLLICRNLRRAAKPF